MRVMGFGAGLCVVWHRFIVIGTVVYYCRRVASGGQEQASV